MLKGTDQEFDDLDSGILVIHYYGYWEYMLIDMEFTILLSGEINNALRSYMSLDNLNLS